MKIVGFYSHCNNGDLHCCRELVRDVVEHGGADRYIFCHRNSTRILQDIAGLEQAPLEAYGKLDQEAMACTAVVDGESAILFNTWYAVSPVWQKGDGFGITLNTLYELFRANLKRHLGHDLREPVEKFIPTMDFSRFDMWKFAVAGRWKRFVLVCNGRPMSGQSRLEDPHFNRAVGEWIDRNPDVLFIVTNGRDFQGLNVVYAADIIGLPPGTCDLPECGYLSTLCDVVVGRGSGAYTFSYLAENFLNPKKTMVCFTDDERVARWIYPTEIVKARILWSPARDYEGARAALAGALT